MTKSKKTPKKPRGMEPKITIAMGGYGRKTTTLVRDLEFFIHTKFHQNPSSGSGKEVDNVNRLTDRRRTDDRRRTTRDHNRLPEPAAPVPKKQSGNVNTPPIFSITQQLRIDFGRLVGATTATQLMWLTGLRAQPSHSLQKPSKGRVHKFKTL